MNNSKSHPGRSEGSHKQAGDPSPLARDENVELIIQHSQFMKILVALPVYNEEAVLEKNTLALLNFLKENLTKDLWQIVIAEGPSQDQTTEIAQSLAQNYPQIKHLKVTLVGKGRAIRSAWQKFPAEIYSFMDVDLSTSLAAFPALIEAIKEERYDLAIGSRFHPASQVERSLTRKIPSWGLRFLLRIFFRLKVKDAPCGFKAVSQRVVQELLPQVENNGWFFDTELLVWAERKGFKIKELPIVWRESPDSSRKSRVKILSLIGEYLREILRLRRKGRDKI